MLEFEHIVQINDPENPRLKTLTRGQLWQGLLLRARDPGRFNPVLSCRIEDESANGFTRFIKAGAAEFKELVALKPRVSISSRTCRDFDQIHAESHVAIEEPAAGYLFARFVYRRELDQSRSEAEQQFLAGHLKAAYQQVDIDAIAMIRTIFDNDTDNPEPH